MNKLTLGAFREFTKDMRDDTEIRIESIYDIINEKYYNTSVDDISSYKDVYDDYIVLAPDTIQIIDDAIEED